MYTMYPLYEVLCYPLGMPNADSLGSLLGYEEAEDTATGSTSTGEVLNSPMQSKDYTFWSSAGCAGTLDCLDESVLLGTLRRSGSQWSDIAGSDQGGLDVIAP